MIYFLVSCSMEKQYETTMLKKYKFNLETKIIIIISVVVVTIISLYSFIITKHYEKYAEKVIAAESISTLTSIDTSLTKVIDNANNVSKIILSDSLIQEQMELGDILSDIGIQQKIRQRVYAILQFEDAVETVWFIDNNEHKLTIGEDAALFEIEERADNNFSMLKRKYGSAELIYLAEGSYADLSLVRSFNSLSSFKTLGVIGVDIKNSEIERIISNSFDLSKEVVIILDSNNSPIYYGGDLLEKDFFDNAVSKLLKKQRTFFEQTSYKGNNYYISGMINSHDRWKIIRIAPYFKDIETESLVQFNLALFISLGLIILFSALFMSGFLTKPISELMSAMHDVENGNLKKIDSKPKMKEFKELFAGFNHMVSRIEGLISETIDRQRRIRQVELNEIQEQMKPHFLYNTLESVEALAMMGDTEKVCVAIEALGDFYRKSVSGGKEFLTIGEEIRIAKDYVQIMEIRFGDSFNAEFRCDNRCIEYMIPKLTIQPLVENAFQHGIRTKNNHGDVFVDVSFEGDNIHITIEDSGDGVPDEIINEVANNAEPVRGKSLGLRGTIERLRLMYGDSFKYIISRKPSKIELFINVGNLSDNGGI